MTNAARSKIEQSVLLAILVLPLLFSGLGGWEVLRGLTTLAEAPFAPQADASADLDRLVARLRLVPAAVALLGGLIAGGAGLAGMGMVAASARQGAGSRPALVASFHRVSRLLPLLLAAQVIGLVSAMLGASVFEASGLWLTPDVDDKAGMLAIMGLVYAGVAVWGSVATLRNLRRALRLFVPQPRALNAVVVTEGDAPGLFALLRELVRERGTTMPETVAVGATDAGFFVSAIPKRLPGLPGEPPFVTRGRILHLPIAGLAVLDPMELRTVLAHELAHFSGDDTLYSLQFQPLYNGLGEGAAAMSVRNINWGGTLPDRLLERVVHPHTVLAVHAYDCFDTVVAQWSRVRELEADRAAVTSGSPAALASSLLRLGLVEDLKAQMLRRIDEDPDAVQADLAAELVVRLATAKALDPAAHLSKRAPHPTDTHPPDRQRIQAAGVAIDDALMARAARSVSEVDFAAAQGLFADWSGLSSGLGTPLLDHSKQRHAARRENWQSLAAHEAQAMTALHASLLRPMLILAVAGLVCLALTAVCILDALYGGEEDRQSWRLLTAIAVAGAIGVGFIAVCGFRLWRGRRQPYLLVSPYGVASPGFEGTLPWLDMSAISVSAQPAQIAFLLRPDAALPPRTGRIRRLQHDAKRHAVQFVGMLPRGMSAAALQAMLLQHAHAAHARKLLDEPTA